jgi:transcriptional regulator with XRE-family HTH domain
MQRHSDRDFGNHVRKLRQGRGLTQEALANRSKLSVDAVRRLEQGAFSPSLNTVRKLSHGLNISLKTMFESFQRRRRELVQELCDFLDDLSGAEVAQAWRVVRAMFEADSEHAK